jgi:outer membrane protein assembly complex protein YaeT
MRPVLRAAVFHAALLLTLVPLPASAQIQPYLGRPIADVRIEIQGQPTGDAELVNVLETRVGEPLAAAPVRESIIHLMALGRFDDVQVNAQPAPQGVVLTYQLRLLRTVGAIRFRGHLGLSESQLRSEVADRYGTSPPLSRASEMAESLRDLYRLHGYGSATVTPYQDAQSRPDQTTLGFDIEAGPQARVEKINPVETDRRIDLADLLRRLQLKQGGPFDPADVNQRVTSYADSLRAKGFYEANIAVSPVYSVDNTAVTLGVTAERGPRVSVELAGDPIPSARLDDLVPIKRENAVDQDLIEDWSGNIERYLRAQGYKDAKAAPERRASADQLRIVFTVRHGPRYVIDAITVTGNQALSTLTILDVLASLKLAVGQPFAERTMEAGIAKILGRYQGEGFTTASAKSDYTNRSDAREVRVGVVVRVSEGPRAIVKSIAFSGNQQVPEAELRRVVRVGIDGPFFLPALEGDRNAILEAYLNRGYQLATVSLPDPKEMMSADRSRADVRFLIREGPQILLDHVLIVGNDHTKASTIRNALQIKPGEPLAYDKLVESQQRVAALGLFRRVQVSQLQRGSETKRDVLVTVQESPATSIAYGGGLEGAKRQRADANGNAVEAIELAPRGLFDIGRRNLWGKNRSINFDSSFAVRPQSTGIVGTGLREYRALGTYREPRIFGAAADLLVAGGVEQAVRPAYSFNRRGVRAEVSHPLSKTLTVYARYALDRTRVVNPPTLQDPQDQILLGRIFPTVRLSKLSSTVVRDTRDDPVDPGRGVLASLDGEVAPQWLGSEVGVAKTILQTFVYRQLPAKRRVVFAGGLRLGFATGFGPTELRDEHGNPVPGPDGKPTIVEVMSPPLSERFFAGGNTTVRGVAEDTLGTPATFVSGFATGGGGLLILNGELRVSVWKSLAAVTFLDAGNVYELASKIQPTNLQPALGVGLRYKSPIGPIRVDLAFNLNRRVLGTQRESLTFISFGVGQAF